MTGARDGEEGIVGSYHLMGTGFSLGRLKKKKKSSGDRQWWCLDNIVCVLMVTESCTQNGYNGQLYVIYILPQLLKVPWREEAWDSQIHLASWAEVTNHKGQESLGKLHGDEWSEFLWRAPESQKLTGGVRSAETLPAENKRDRDEIRPKNESRTPTSESL